MSRVKMNHVMRVEMMLDEERTDDMMPFEDIQKEVDMLAKTVAVDLGNAYGLSVKVEVMESTLVEE